MTAQASASLSVSRPPPLPGFGLDLDHNKRKDVKLFPSALTSNLTERTCKDRLPLLTLREIAMIRFMNEVTDRNDWERKVSIDTIAEEWATEAIQSIGADFTREMADYCIAELKYKAEHFKETGFVRVYNGDVIKSDCAIPNELRAALKVAIAPLEQVPDHRKDWHPGSDDKVLNLLNPSLFPLVYGTSRILTDRTIGLEDCISSCGHGEVAPIPPEKDLPPPSWPGQWQGLRYGRKFQWLPCDVDVSCKRPRIVSYINNLHPREHAHLYEVIEKCLEKIIPLWNATLTALRTMKWKGRIKYDTVDYGDLDAYVEKEGPKQLENEVEWAFIRRRYDWKRTHIPDFIIRPNPLPFFRDDEGLGKAQSNSLHKDDGGTSPVDLRKDFTDTGLQIIVKMVNIHLTPEKPTHEDGGAWKIEGQLNEQICATAVYCYDVENITPGHLTFRQASDVVWAEEKIHYEEDDADWLEPIFGMQDHRPANQIVGSIQAREGRVITFPNLLQHQSQSYKLVNPAEPGHCKILVFYLVDPNIKIISTSNVPCQQREWWGDAVFAENDSTLGKLPFELREKVIEDVDDFPLSLEQAQEFRQQLIEERKNSDLTSVFYHVGFEICYESGFLIID